MTLPSPRRNHAAAPAPRASAAPAASPKKAIPCKPNFPSKTRRHPPNLPRTLPRPIPPQSRRPRFPPLRPHLQFPSLQRLPPRLLPRRHRPPTQTASLRFQVKASASCAKLAEITPSRTTTFSSLPNSSANTASAMACGSRARPAVAIVARKCSASPRSRARIPRNSKTSPSSRS